MQSDGKSLKNLFIAIALFVFTMIASDISVELHLSFLVPNGMALSFPPIFPIGMAAVFIFLKRQLKCIDDTKYFFRFCIKLSMFVIGFAVFSSGGLIISEVILALLSV